MWILQIRSESDGLDLIYTSQNDISEEMKVLYFDIWANGDAYSDEKEPGRFTLIRRSDNVILAQMWQEY